MKALIQFVEKRPLALSLLAFVASMPCVGLMVAFGNTGYHFDSNALGLCASTLTLSFLALLNLIKADRQGYSSTKIGLSVTALFFAFVPEICLTLKLLRYIGER
jgi:hypothetical protein